MMDCRIDSHVAVLTLSNPPANTFTVETLQQLGQWIARLNANPAIRAVVITGQGEKFFSAGADLKVFSGDDRDAAATLIQAFGAAFTALREARPVMIAAINGYAMGGGFECALACDIRLAEQQVQLGLPEPSVGLLPGAGGTQLLTRLVGESWAKRMILTGERINAATAERIGLVQQVVPAGQALGVALGMARRIAGLGPQAVSFSKQLIHLAHYSMPLGESLEIERARFMELYDGSDRREGVAAFLEKRTPVWSEA